MKNISIFGTSSDAGKSTLTFVIAKILQNRGYSVAPFKAQNVSNNAYVCDDGSEISVAQYFQAKVLGLETSYHLNPVLLKSGRNSSASVIVEGKVVASQDVLAYYKDLDKLKPAVNRCFEYLDTKYDCVVSEGAGSPVELNLMDKDLSNIYVATQFNTKIILVADIQRGGVFASIYGVYHLLPKELQKNVVGVIVNKFCGDMSLFDEGVRIIEQQFKIPVLGVLPYIPFNLGFEDSQSLKNYTQDMSQAIIRVGVIAYPYMSNYNDFEPLIADSNIALEFIDANGVLDKYDMIIMPGSKLVIKDLQWLKKVGLFDKIQAYQGKLLGICGGYEMMFEKLLDEHCIENDEPTVELGLNFIDDIIIFEKKKHLFKGKHTIFGHSIEGFEIHHGQSKKYPLQYEKENIKGTFLHAIFDNNAIRTSLFTAIHNKYIAFDFPKYKETVIKQFISKHESRLDVQRILKALI